MLRLPEVAQLTELLFVRFGDLLMLRRRDELFLTTCLRGFVEPFRGREVFAELRHTGRAKALSRCAEHFEAQTKIAAAIRDFVKAGG